MDKSMKEKVVDLRNEGKTYNEIKKILGISKATISYHLKSVNLGTTIKKMSDDVIELVKEYYKNHTAAECAAKFKVSEVTIKKYADLKRIKLNDEERKKNKYQYVKSFRQRGKEKLVKYKGGKCEKCGYDKCIWALDFHHKNPDEKDFTISNYQHLKMEILYKEVDKCILVCSNCHREIHAGYLEI
jgi:DNA-binding CsgD family transcriptional regulator